MKTDPVILAAVMQWPETERIEFAMSILDEMSPLAMDAADIESEAARRQDEIESGAVPTIGYDELVAGLSYQPRSLAK